MLENNDFAMEYRLQVLDERLHRRFTDAVFALQKTLLRYKRWFPEYTDHTSLHSISVADFCNRLIGRQVEQLSADELYVLLMGCYFHDTGMGISQKDYEEFSASINFGDYFDSHSREDYPTVIRDFHQEFSGRFIMKYAGLFDIPSEEHTWAIVQVARGHRRTNLMDETEFPVAMKLSGGGTICLPYLAALMRLADEIDVTAARNPVLIYDIDALTDARQIIENKKVKAVKELQIEENCFRLIADDPDREILDGVRTVAEKMQRTLDDCRTAVLGRTPFVITQKYVILETESGRTGAD